MSSSASRSFRRLPGTRWSAIRINWRWIVQGVSLIAGIFFFMRAFDTSKILLLRFSVRGLAELAGLIILFGLCFAILLLTSYLKERGNQTLRHRIAIFEKLIARLGLDNYSETRQASNNAHRSTSEPPDRNGREKQAA